MPQAAQQFVGQVVVLDTQGPLVYIGRLEAIDADGYWLTEADVHNRQEGHSTNERYVNDAVLLEQAGARNVNRRRVFVLVSAVASISRLEDIAAEGPSANPGAWLK